MKEIALEAPTASSCAVTPDGMGGVEGWGVKGVQGGGGEDSKMARQFAICCEKPTRNIQSAGVLKTWWHQDSASQAQSWPEA